jgi:hypothetical protein
MAPSSLLLREHRAVLTLDSAGTGERGYIGQVECGRVAVVDGYSSTAPGAADI